ncbi:MAG: hypothetical protein COT59_00025 [Candidatus Nealsonbacteria bacterium CG09_land_8_20_14_0_10_42_14]|uniref:Uncharacterized protein n=1 Tax=Candidatus Nealsonbacteria bacterium CG09_land_8_20_14_0_10_42_14 TaxID=1974707 RepID=A0A2H0WY07_9BACT|nr:MAG: hypothetical protein COT59_00025 [Candidatus Nealsonbacteria bacterium CG09_land_8_20_14_0_10_42_14]
MKNFPPAPARSKKERVIRTATKNETDAQIRRLVSPGKENRLGFLASLSFLGLFLFLFFLAISPYFIMGKSFKQNKKNKPFEAKGVKRGRVGKIVKEKGTKRGEISEGEMG